MVRPVIGTPDWGDDLNADLDGIEALALNLSGKMIVSSTVTASGPLVIGRHHPVNATSGVLTLTLPTGATSGDAISLEKVDLSANDVFVTGNIRGVPGSSVQLGGEYSGTGFIADSAGSWWPVNAVFSNSVLDAVGDIALAESDPPAAPAPTALAGSQDTYSRGDHVHPSAGLFTQWGSALDGDVTFDGTTTVNLADTGQGGTSAIVPVAGVYTLDFPIAARNLTLGNGVVLAVQQGVTIYVSDTLVCPTGSAVIHADGNAGAANGTAGASRPARMIGSTGAGGAGNTGAGSGSGTSAGESTLNIINGGNGGLGPSGAGGSGSGGGLLYNERSRYMIGRVPDLMFHGMLRDQREPGRPLWLVGATGGGGGGGDGTNKGGGGGSGAGVLIVNARRIVGNITFRARGGDGGSPTTGNAGGGGGGGGGAVFVNTTDASLYTGPSVTGSAATYARGGIGGTKVGTGVNGSNGSNGYLYLTTWA